jgi:hypothetical protein
MNSLFGTDRMVKRYGKVIIYAVVIWAIVSIIVIFLICRPFSYSWNTNQPGSCGNRNDMYIINGIGNMILDVAVLALPLPTIWKLKLPTAQKLGLAVIFSLGILLVNHFAAFPGSRTYFSLQCYNNIRPPHQGLASC